MELHLADLSAFHPSRAMTKICDQARLAQIAEPPFGGRPVLDRVGTGLSEHEFSIETSQRHRIPSLPSVVTIELPPSSVCIEVVGFYFRFIHDPSHALFHRSSFLNDLSSGTIPEVVILVVLALAARFSKDAYFEGIHPRARAEPYIQQAERLFNLHDVSLTTIRTAILLAAFYGTEGDSIRENIYYTVACRMGMLLDVPNFPAATPLEQELNIRLWWTLEQVDVWASNGKQLPRVLFPRDDVQMPVEESVFLNMSQELTSPTPLSPPQRSTASLLGQTVKLNAILAEVANVNRAAATSTLPNFQFDATVDLIAKKLDSWEAQLPGELKNYPENLTHYALMGQGGAFVALHVGYYHLGQLLYYQYLHWQDANQLQDTTSHAVFCADMCRANSTSLCELIYQTYSTSGAEVQYTMVGHVLVIASTVQLHILLFSHNEQQVQAARGRLERNFNILTQLQHIWPALDVSFGRFREFHQACLRSKKGAGSAFRMDKWMLQFLLEFASPISEKPASDDEDEDLGSLDLQNWTMEGITPNLHLEN